jgi:CspA family cold shock protein
MAELMRGTVKWFNDAKGFGFIQHETGKDVFVHYSVIEAEGFKTLKDGEEVTYELREGEKGLNAARVMRVNAPKVVEKSVASMIEVEKTGTSEKSQTILGRTQSTEKELLESK